MIGYLFEHRPEEIYHITLSERGFIFTIRDTFFKYLCKKIKNENVLEFFLNIPLVIRSAETVSFFIDLPFISFPNYKKQKLDYYVLGQVAKKIEILLKLFNSCEKDGFDYKPFALSDKEQLMIISSLYIDESEFRSSPVSVAFSESVRKKLKENYLEDVILGDCEKIAHDIFLRLSEKNKRKYEKESKNFLRYRGGFMGITVMIRSGGVPHFIVPGNCACLGANPDQFKYSGEMDSHNMDSSLQQITMLAALVTFWNDILEPLQKDI